MPLAEVVGDVEAVDERGELRPGGPDAISASMVSSERRGARSARCRTVCAIEMPQRPGRGRMPLAVYVSSSDSERLAFHDLAELPPQVDGILDAETDPLPARRVVDVRGVSRRAARARCGTSRPAGSRHHGVASRYLFL